MLNMNVDKRMVIEATNKKTFQDALASDIRLVIVNLQKFGSVREMLDADVLQKLAKMYLCLLDQASCRQGHRTYRVCLNQFDNIRCEE